MVPLTTHHSPKPLIPHPQKVPFRQRRTYDGLGLFQGLLIHRLRREPLSNRPVLQERHGTEHEGVGRGGRGWRGRQARRVTLVLEAIASHGWLLCSLPRSDRMSPPALAS